MVDKVSRVMFYLFSFLLFFTSVNEVCNKQFIDAFIIFAIGIILNPFVLDSFLRKLGVERMDYVYVLKVIGVFAGTLIAYVIAFLIFYNSELKNGVDAISEFYALFKMCLYLIYLLTLFGLHSSNKRFKYIVFGGFYLICVVLSFSTGGINKIIIDMLNFWFSDNNMIIDAKTYDILVNAFLIPIKESILTYIIFDTVFEAKSNKELETDVQKDMCESAKAVEAVRYVPYNFDFKYEYRTFKNIGRKNKIDFGAKKNILYRFQRWIRKRWNCDDKRYKNFDTYSEWKEYMISSTKLKDDFSNNDFVHYLRSKLRMCDCERSFIGSIVTPIYVTIPSGMLTILVLLTQDNTAFFLVSLIWWTFGILLICMLTILYAQNRKTWSKYSFYEACIEVLEKHNG